MFCKGLTTADKRRNFPCLIRMVRSRNMAQNHREEEMKPFLVDESPSAVRPRTSSRDVPLGEEEDKKPKTFLSQTIAKNPEFFAQAVKFVLCFCGLQASYLTCKCGYTRTQNQYANLGCFDLFLIFEQFDSVNPARHMKGVTCRSS